MFPLRLSLFALLLLAVLGLSQEAEGGLVEVYVNDVDLVIAEAVVTVESETDFDVIIRLSGPYRIDSGNDTFSVYSILIQIDFLNDADPRDSVMGIPQYQPLDDNEDDPGYDEVLSRFRSNDAAFENYYGDFQIVMVMKNGSGELIWENTFEMYMSYKQKPDLYVRTLDFSNNYPEIGDVVTINATVGLIGANVTDNFSVGFYLDAIPSENGTEIGVVHFNDSKMAIGDTFFVSINWTAVNGTHRIFVVADSNEVIDESVEKNEISKAIIVGFVEPEPNETSDTTDDTTSNTEETTTEAEEVEERDYTMIIAGVGAMIAASILGAAVILKR